MDILTHRITQWPTALLPALRLVWTRTLFAGDSQSSPARAASWLMLIVLPGLVLYPCLNFRLLEPDEGRYAEIPREMLARGEWIVPKLQGQPYLDKPPLLYWSVMLSYSLFGVHDWAARLVPALAVHACILMCYGFGCRIIGERRALRGAIFLSIIPGLVGIGRVLTLDGLLTLWVSLALLSGFLRFAPGASRWMSALFTMACGLGVLTKGPVALVLVLVPLMAWKWLHPDRTQSIRWQSWLWFAAGIMAINLPWYVAVCVRQPEFAKYFFWKHNLERFFNPFDHPQPFWYYGPILFAGLLPLSLLVIPLLKSMLSDRPDLVRRRSPELGFFLMAGGFCVLFFSLSGAKLPTYILPAFPMLALTCGVLLETEGQLFTRRQWILGTGWVIFLGLVQALVLPWYADERSPMHEAEIVTRICGDKTIPIVAFPRNCDSVAFYLQRDDINATRSKHVNSLIDELMSQPRTIVLFTHRHSFDALTHALPKQLRLTRAADFRKTDLPGPIASVIGNVPWGLCDLGVVERVSP